jgi:hypothetical protein
METHTYTHEKLGHELTQDNHERHIHLERERESP